MKKVVMLVDVLLGGWLLMAVMLVEKAVMVAVML
jgi:hypothetical protein